MNKISILLKMIVSNYVVLLRMYKGKMKFSSSAINLCQGAVLYQLSTVILILENDVFPTVSFRFHKKFFLNKPMFLCRVFIHFSKMKLNKFGLCIGVLALLLLLYNVWHREVARNDQLPFLPKIRFSARKQNG